MDEQRRSCNSKFYSTLYIVLSLTKCGKKFLLCSSTLRTMHRDCILLIFTCFGEEEFAGHARHPSTRPSRFYQI